MDKRGRITNRNALGYQDDGYEVGPQDCADRDGDITRAPGEWSRRTYSDSGYVVARRDDQQIIWF
jgi:hypothetical protein